MCWIFLVEVSCAETMRVPVRDLERLNEKKRTYIIETKNDLKLYASEVAWSDTLVTILELDPTYHPDSTAAIFVSLPVTLRVENIESIGRVTTDTEEMALVILLIVGIPIVVGLVVREFFVQILPED